MGWMPRARTRVLRWPSEGARVRFIRMVIARGQRPFGCLVGQLFATAVIVRVQTRGMHYAREVFLLP